MGNCCGSGGSNKQIESPRRVAEERKPRALPAIEEERKQQPVIIPEGHVELTEESKFHNAQPVPRLCPVYSVPPPSSVVERQEQTALFEIAMRNQMAFRRMTTLRTLLGLEIILEEQEPPYTGFMKVVSGNGCVEWKRYPKASPSKLQLKKIKEMKSESARQLLTEEKRLWFYSKIDDTKRFVGRTQDFLSTGPIVLLVERTNFLRDSFEQFRTTTDLDLRREIKIHFIDEVCQDAGGLIREWFSVLTEELFAPSFGLFLRTNTPNLSYTINPRSDLLCHDHLEHFFFCGQILAKAIFEKIPIKAYLSKYLFKRLISTDLTLDDLKYFDMELWRSMNFLKTTKLSPDTCMGTFAILRRDPAGKEEQCELKPNGSSIAVDEHNKGEFIDLFFKYHLIKATEKQFNELSFGFSSLIPAEILQVLDCDELELFLCGEQSISLQDWRDNTKYKGVYNDQHQTIKWFWEVLGKLTKDELEKFLQFCTGSTRAPAEGFKGLTSNNGKICPFCVESRNYANDGTDFLVAHTCFNRLELPLYPDLQHMETVIRKIIATPLCYQFSFE